MDTFELCRIASERVAWSFEHALGNLKFDFERRFLPSRICGSELPKWLDPASTLKINQIRAFSYAHIFLSVEQFIIQSTCISATEYIHNDRDALSAMLRFTDEETKHQRMFEMVKQLVADGLGFRPRELPDMEERARAICQHSPFAVYLSILMIEWYTQRHYVECFREEESDLDPNFVKVFRLHWTEEAQHARIDAIKLRMLVQNMSPSEITMSITEFSNILNGLHDMIRKQDILDIDSIAIAINIQLTDEQRNEILQALHKESFWTFLMSGLEHTGFSSVYDELVSSEATPLAQIQKIMWEASQDGDRSL